jgi:type II secretory pathway pseudopilin PulG
MRRRFSASLNGFTLAELLLTAAILAFALSGLLLLFINAIFLNATTRNTVLAYSAIQAEMEQKKNTAATAFSSLAAGEANFNLEGFSAEDGQGRIKIENLSSNFKKITIRACFMCRKRLIGDSINNCQRSPVELITLITAPR